MHAHLLVGRQQPRNAAPDGTRAAALGEAEHGVGPPARVLLAAYDVANGAAHVDRRNALAQPLALHLRRRHGPHLGGGNGGERQQGCTSSTACDSGMCKQAQSALYASRASARAHAHIRAGTLKL